MTHNDYEEEERRNDWNVPIQFTPLRPRHDRDGLERTVPTSTNSHNWRAKKIHDVTPLDLEPGQGSKWFYLRDIIEKGKGEFRPYNGRYIIKHLGSDVTHPYIFAVYGALSNRLIPNSTIGFKVDISDRDLGIDLDLLDTSGHHIDVDRLYNDKDGPKWFPLIRNGTRIGPQPSTEPSTELSTEPSADGGRRRRRKTKRARRGRRRSSRKA